MSATGASRSNCTACKLTMVWCIIKPKVWLYRNADRQQPRRWPNRSDNSGLLLSNMTLKFWRILSTPWLCVLFLDQNLSTVLNAAQISWSGTPLGALNLKPCFRICHSLELWSTYTLPWLNPDCLDHVRALCLASKLLGRKFAKSFATKWMRLTAPQFGPAVL